MGEPWLLGSDSIAIWDSGNRRLTVFDINGGLGRSFRLDPIPDAGSPRPQGILADNSLLVTATIRLEGGRPQGIWQDSIVYAQYSLEGANVVTFVRRPGTLSIAASLSGGMTIMGSVMYSTSPTATVFGDRWYYGSGDSWEIGVYSPDGALTHLLRRDEPNRPFFPEEEEEDPESDSGPQSDQDAAFDEFFASMPIPETFPAYRSFKVSDDGNLWVENYIYRSEQPSWAVFRHDGRYLGEVETPMGARITHIGDDFMLAIWQDELEIQQVHMYELIKP